jgi:hypothetical protein
MPIFLGNQSVGAAALGNLPVSQIANLFPFEPAIPTDDLIFWLDATTFTTGSSTWQSNFGLAYSGSLTGVTPVQKLTDNGGAVNFTTSSAMRIGGATTLDYQAEDFTLIVINRYSGSASDRHGRLLSSPINNWLAPTYGGDGGGGSTEYWAAYYNASTFIIQSGSIYDTEWRMSSVVRDTTNLSSSFYVNDSLAATGASNATTNGFNTIAINKSAFSDGETNPGTGEVTQGDVGDVILYNRVLNQSEITEVYNALKGRYGI